VAGRRIAGVVFITDAEVEIAERHPHSFAAPAHMDGLAYERHRLLNAAQVFGASFSSKRALKVKSPTWTMSWLIDDPVMLMGKRSRRAAIKSVCLHQPAYAFNRIDQ